MPGTSFQFPGLNQKHIQKGLPYSTLVFDQILFLQHLIFQRKKHECNFHYEEMPMMTSQILRSVDFTKSQKPRYPENKTSLNLQIKRFIN